MSSDPWFDASVELEGKLSHPRQFGFDPEAFATAIQQLVYGVDRPGGARTMEVDAAGDLLIVAEDDEESLIVVSEDSITYFSGDPASFEELQQADHVWRAQAVLAAQLWSRRRVPRLDACSLSLGIVAPFASGGEQFRRRYLGGPCSALAGLAPGAELHDVALTFFLPDYQGRVLLGFDEEDRTALLEIRLEGPRPGPEQFFESAFAAALEVAQRALHPSPVPTRGSA